MSTERVILACEMIEDEVRLALEALPPADRPPLVWMESGLHDRPETLQAAWAELIRMLDEGADEGRARGRAVGAARARPGCRAPRGGHRGAGERGGPRPRVLRQRPQGPRRGAPHPGLPAGGRLRLAAPERRLRARGDQAEPALLLPHPGLVQPRELDDQRRSTSGTRGTAASGPTSCARPCTPATRPIHLIDTQAYEVEECIDQSQAVADRLKLEHGVVPRLGATARAAVQRGEGQRDRRRCLPERRSVSTICLEKGSTRSGDSSTQRQPGSDHRRRPADGAHRRAHQPHRQEAAG